MKELIEFTKIMCLLQVFLIFMLVFSIYIYKIYINRRNKKKNKIALKIDSLFNQYIKQHTEITPADFKLFRYDLIDLLSIIKRFDVQYKTNSDWQKNKNHLMKSFLLPKARKNATKRSWYKRYIATQIFQVFFEKKDLTVIKQLIADQVPLIALNATKIAATTPSAAIIEQLITSFSANRILQNALFIQAIELTPPALLLVAKHLNHEKDLYSRVFCYQLLNNHPEVCPEEKQIQKDINSKNLDLQIAALTFYCSTKPKNLTSFFAEKIQDERWEIRARIAKLIGMSGDTSVCQLLGNVLRDPNWWVRINAAESLYQLGSEGIAILKQQNPEDDRFAYDAAERVLATAQMKEQL